MTMLQVGLLLNLPRVFLLPYHRHKPMQSLELGGLCFVWVFAVVYQLAYSVKKEDKLIFLVS